jgi:very-short-patch-repair endonuclease
MPCQPLILRGDELLSNFFIGQIMHNNFHFKTQKELSKHLARELRKNSTKAEKIFWDFIRNRRFNGIKFYRQYVIFYNDYDIDRFFIADFYSHEKKLIVELDGGIHTNQKEYDNIREQIIKQKGIRVIRFKNEQVENRIDWVLEKLTVFIE